MPPRQAPVLVKALNNQSTTKLQRKMLERVSQAVLSNPGSCPDTPASTAQQKRSAFLSLADIFDRNNVKSSQVGPRQRAALAAQIKQSNNYITAQATLP